MTVAENYSRDFLVDVPQGLVDAHDKANAEVIRWVTNGVQASKIIETNADHVDSEHVIIEEIFNKYSGLTKGVDRLTVHQLVHIHDSPEIITGDDSLGNDNHLSNRERRWERERIAFGVLTRPETVPDPILRKKLRTLFARYNNTRPEKWERLEGEDREILENDREALLAHLVDKIQAIRFGLENVFKTEKDCERSINGLIHFAVPLFKATPIEGQGELIQLVLVELDRFKQHDFSGIANQGIGQFLSKISSLI